MYALKLTGSPKECGLLHGKTFKSQIHEIAAIRRQLLSSYMSPLSNEEVEAIVQKQIDRFRTHSEPNAQEAWQEFEGISEGASISHIDLMILNNYTDLRDFGYSKSLHDEGCSVFAYESPSAHFCGQTWDMHASARPYMLHLETPHQAHVLTVTGCLGLAGVNSKGVAVMVNNLHCKESEFNLPWPGLIRCILERPTAPTALDYITKHLPSSGHNYLICDPKFFYNIESTGKRIALSHQSKKDDSQKTRYTWHTNHYITELKSIEITERRSPTTEKRFAEVERILKNAGPQTADGILNTLFGNPAICMPRPQATSDPKTLSPHVGMTCGGLWLDYKTGQARFFGGTYDEKDFRDFRVRLS